MSENLSRIETGRDDDDDLVELSGGAVVVARQEHAAERVAEGLHQAQLLGHERPRRRRLHQMQLVQCAATTRTPKESVARALIHPIHGERERKEEEALACP